MIAHALLCVSTVAGQTSEKVYGGTAGEINSVVGKAVTHTWATYVGASAYRSHNNGYVDAWDEDYCITNAGTSTAPASYISALGTSGNYSAIGLLGMHTGAPTSPDFNTYPLVPGSVNPSFYLSTISYRTHEFDFGEFAVPDDVPVGQQVFLTITVSDMDDFCRHSPPILENVTVGTGASSVTTFECVLETLRLYIDGVYIPPASGTRATLVAEPGSANSTITYTVKFTLQSAHGSTVNITASQGLTLNPFSAASFTFYAEYSTAGCYNKTYNTSCCLLAPSSSCSLPYMSPCDTTSGMRVEHVFLSAANVTTTTAPSTATTAPSTATTAPSTLAADLPTCKEKKNSMNEVALGVIIGLSTIIVIGGGIWGVLARRKSHPSYSRVNL